MELPFPIDPLLANKMCYRNFVRILQYVNKKCLEYFKGKIIPYFIVDSIDIDANVLERLHPIH